MSEVVREEEQWTEVISPKANLLDLRLQDVWNYRDLLILFVKRDFAAQYKQTVLGPIVAHHSTNIYHTYFLNALYQDR